MLGGLAPIFFELAMRPLTGGVSPGTRVKRSSWPFAILARQRLHASLATLYALADDPQALPLAV